MPIIVPPPADEQVDDERFCSDCFAGMESSEHYEKCVRPTRLLEDIAAVLHEIYDPAGALIWWSARIKYLDDKRPCDIWRDRDMALLERINQRLNALADGAFC